MSIKRGDIVSHCGAIEWGAGKVIEVCQQRVSVHFNDGVVRKIASSHFGKLLPAEPGSFAPASVAEPKVPVKAALPKVKKPATRKAAAH